MIRQFRRALVTGASRGIGAAIATQLAGEGVDLVLVARTTDDLRRLADRLERANGITVEVLAADLLDPADLDRVTDRVSASPVIDLVVNNAGFGTAGRFDTLDPAGEEDQVRLNVTALLRLSHAAAATFRDRAGGGILNVSSLSAFAPAPHTATYAASKAFVNSFTEALHEELKPAGVHVSTLCPGFTRTAFHDAAAMTTDRLPSRIIGDADAVARAAVAGVRDNRAVVVPGAANRTAAGLTRMLPGTVVRRVAGQVAARLPG
jgi:short-subunit dehydrogenase